MIKYIALFLILASHLVYSQQSEGPYFHSLTGIRDYAYNTNLFYRIYRKYYEAPYIRRNDVYKMNIEAGTDTVLFSESGAYSSFSLVNDFEFWQDNPSLYVRSGFFAPTEFPSYYYIWCYTGSFTKFSYSVYNIETSRQDENFILAQNGTNIIKSTNKGQSWSNLADYFSLESLDPHDTNIIFARDQGSRYFKSTDGGNSFTMVDTSKYSKNLYQKNFYDNDGFHIYRVVYGYDKYQLLVSSNRGNASSWAVSFTSTYPIAFTMDQEKSGQIYISDRNRILESFNYGETFQEYRKLKNDIRGLYKKVNVRTLYAATNQDIFEIAADSIKSLKHLIPESENLYYRLLKGFKCVYYSSTTIYDSIPRTTNGYIIRTVTGDTTAANGKKYAVISESAINQNIFYKNISYERIDTATGLAYEYIPDANNSRERLIDDLTSEVGDTIIASKFQDNSVDTCKILVTDQSAVVRWNNTWFVKKMKFINSLRYSSFNYLQSVGLDDASKSEQGMYSQHIWLKNFTYNGYTWGDTSSMSISNSKVNPAEFILYQNFPNPFNGNTTITYNLLKPEKVELIIYNILGQEMRHFSYGQMLPGFHKISFESANLPSGIYLYRLQTQGFTMSKRMCLLK